MADAHEPVDVVPEESPTAEAPELLASDESTAESEAKAETSDDAESATAATADPVIDDEPVVVMSEPIDVVVADEPVVDERVDVVVALDQPTAVGEPVLPPAHQTDEADEADGEDEVDEDVDQVEYSEVPLLDEQPDVEVATAAAPVGVQAPVTGEVVLSISGLTKRFGDKVAVDSIALEVPTGSFYGIVGPNGAGKTTTLSMVTGLLRPDAGTVTVHGINVWQEPERAKRSIGVLPDALKLFDRLTGAQLLYYSGILRGLDRETVVQRSADLAKAFGIDDAVNRLVTDYSAGMTKKIALAAAMIHSPRLLVLDEPFESVDPVSAANLIEILQRYVASGGTVVLSSHGMDFIQRVCDHVAVIVGGKVLASGTMDQVRGAHSLEDRFVELAGGRKAAEGMEWLHSFSD